MNDQSTSFTLNQPLPMQQKTLAEMAFDELSKRIISGALRSGERLVEADIAAEFGTSRAPIREALSQLVREGLAIETQRRGTFVRPWTKQDLWEVATLRANLEALAVKYAIPCLTADDLEFIHRKAHAMEDVTRNGDIERLMELDTAVHDLLVQRCPHTRLKQLLRNMRLQIRIFQLITGQTDLESQADKKHMILFRALRERDPDLAYNTIYEHFIQSAENALAGLPEDSELVVPRVRPDRDEFNDLIVEKHSS